MSQLNKNPASATVVLPGGYFHNDTCFREVKIHPPNGRMEEILAETSNSEFLASTVTNLLIHCIEQIGLITEMTSEVVQNLLVGDRDYLVLKLRQITLGDKIEATLLCPNSQCSEKIDFDFDLRDIPIKPGKISTPVFTIKLSRRTSDTNNKGGKQCTVKFRLPNGGDQEALASQMLMSQSSAEKMLLARCIQQIDGVKQIDESQIDELLPNAQEKLEKMMEELAPHVDFEMEAQCPECQSVFPLSFNISQFFINELKTNLNQLYQEVHFLAFYYKWSESDILAMTRKKRKKYLELLREQIETSQ